MNRAASTRPAWKSSGFSWKKGKSRLIDSYADGIIDKTDFEPKIQQLKNRLEQIDGQIQESRRHGAVQSELFLVINRLEEFATAVTEKLDSIDLEMKRKIVLGLVKRVEIHTDEIVVVFRVDPQPQVLNSENPNDSDNGVKSMHHCTRRNDCPLWRSSIPRYQSTVGHTNRRDQPSLDV